MQPSMAKGLDLRGNGLSAIRSLTSLRHAAIEPSQTLQLGRAMVVDLQLPPPDD